MSPENQQSVGRGVPAVFSEVTEVTGLFPKGAPPEPPRIWVTNPKYAAAPRKSHPSRREPFRTEIPDPEFEIESELWGDEEDGEWPLHGEPPFKGVKRGVGPIPRHDDFPIDEADRKWSAAECCAFYYPWHLGGNEHWGIYFRTRRMQNRVARFERELGVGGLRNLIWTEVLEHELEHYEQEKALTIVECLLGERLLGESPFHPGHSLGYGQVYGGNQRPGQDRPILHSDGGDKTETLLVHEALATARQVQWAERQVELGLAPPDYARYLRGMILGDDLPGYREFEFCMSTGERDRARAAFVGVQRNLVFPQGTNVGIRAAKRAFGPRSKGKAPDFEKGVKTYAGVPIYEILR